MLANYSVTYSAIDTQGINYFYTKILHLAFLHCAGPETDHVTHSDSDVSATGLKSDTTFSNGMESDSSEEWTIITHKKNKGKKSKK